MGKARRRRGQRVHDRDEPTEAQLASRAFERGSVMHVESATASEAYRRKPVIVSMFQQWLREERDHVPASQRQGINDRQFDMLSYYRDQATLADRSPVRSCCDITPRSGHGPGIAIQSAIRETWRMERDMGLLWRIARAVAVDDKTLTQWCIDEYGGRDHPRDGIIPKCAGLVHYARLELRAAADRLVC